MTDLKAPFPYFGGKSRIAAEVWQRLGDVPNFVEPFFGSGAILLGRPTKPGIETVNDLCGFIANFWRAVQADPDAVAHHADWPVLENDMHARHAWLVGQMDSMQARLEGDPDWFDTKVAGWWCWGICCWIGGGFCSGTGPWRVVDGKLVRTEDAGQGVSRQCICLGDAGQGVRRQRIDLHHQGRGLNRDTPIREWMQALADRLRRVRVCCGDWGRVCTETPTTKNGLTGVFLDPPYGDNAGRDMTIYRVESGTVAADVQAWALAHGDDPLMRIALCGYEGEHVIPGSWECLAWKTAGGYSSEGTRGSENAARERVWFSPHCAKAEKQGVLLFNDVDDNGDEQ
jgi:DNA adenine methylase